MTGKELIIYILQNNLEDEQVIADSKLLGFMTVDEAAAKFGVGVETVKTWVLLGVIEHVLMDTKIYIPINTEPKID